MSSVDGPTEESSLFVGGFSNQITEDDLSQAFGVYGTITKLTMRKGYAFINFADPSSLHEAVALHGTSLRDGRKLGVRVQTPENRAQHSKSPATATLASSVPMAIMPLTYAAPQAAKPTIFVGGFPPDTTPEEIGALFSGYGVLESLAMKKKYAFVVYSDPSLAHSVAPALDGLLFKGKALGVRIQAPENQKNGAVLLANSPTFLTPPVAADTPSLFVGGFGPGLTEIDIRNLVGPYGGITSVSLYKGYAFVKFSSHGAAEMASSALDGTILNGRPLGVRVQYQRNPVPGVKLPGIPSSVPAPPAALPTTHTGGKLPSLFVGGLPASANERDLRLLFAPHGTITGLTIKKKFAFIDYGEAGSAERAAAILDGFMLDGSTLGVRVQDYSARKAVSTAAARYTPY